MKLKIPLNALQRVKHFKVSEMYFGEKLNNETQRHEANSFHHTKLHTRSLETFEIDMDESHEKMNENMQERIPLFYIE